MIYDKKKIGDRIRHERIHAKIKSQGDLAVKLNYSEDSRQTVAKWENGKVLPPLEILIKMCELFDCELGYLLCEYDCKTREITDINKITGLSEKSIRVLTSIKHSEIREVLDTLTKLIEHKDFISLLKVIHLHIWDFNKNHFNMDSENLNSVSKILNCKPKDVKGYMESSSKLRIETLIMNIIGGIDHKKKKERSTNNQKKLLPLE